MGESSYLHGPDRRDFIKQGIGALATLGLGETILLTPGQAQPPKKQARTGRVRNDYKKAKQVPSVCLNCSTVCGIIGHVIDGKLVKVSGNPEDPNNGKTLCAKGQSGPTINDYPDRLLYPLRRVGPRGSGLWKRITWDEAYAELAGRIKPCLDDKHPERVAIHIGRSRIADIMNRFLDAIGSPVLLNHRALCSLNKRAANYATIGETDWETVDAEHSKYLLNFGSNPYECHQGHVHFLKRIIKGRFDNGAKLVTLDVRLSNTAGRSDEWLAPLPGTEGAVALAMGHAILHAGLYDAAFLERWSNVGIKRLFEFYKPYTPAWAAQVSSLDAKDIERIALEFARARPRCAAWTNRGSQAHYNGFDNDRAVILLNALVGSIGQVGGYGYGEAEGIDPKKYPPPEPIPPKVKIRTDLEDPPEYPIANYWQKMKVGQLVYAYIKDKRAKVDVYLSYTLASPTTWPEGRSLAVEVLKDETLIPFHACSDIVYSETAHYADLILPDATYLERWGLDSRNNYEFRHYVTLRQPLTPPPGECVSFAEILIQLGKRLGPDVAKYFPFKDHEEFVRHQCKLIPKGDCADGFEYMKKHGVYSDLKAPTTFDLFKRPLAADALKDTRVDEKTGVVYGKGAGGKEEALGIMVDGTAVRGFKTPSRKFEVLSATYIDQAKKVDFPTDGLPQYLPIPAHADLGNDRFFLVTFKWNVHTQGRTAAQKYLSEIVHSNPMWINAATARKLGIKTGDLVELTTFRPKGKTFQATGAKLGTARVRAFVTEGIHPRVLAVSNSVGQEYGGRAAIARRGPRPQGPGYDPKVIPEDPDLSENLWWDPKFGGAGAGFNVNAILPIQPSPVTGMQSWYDTVCTVRKA